MGFLYERAKADKKHKANETGTKEKKKEKSLYWNFLDEQNLCLDK